MIASRKTLDQIGTLVIATLAIAAFAACQSRLGALAPGSATGAPEAGPTWAAQPSGPSDQLVRQTLADLRTAVASHDARLRHAYLIQLRKELGANVVDASDGGYRQVLSDLRAADAQHDAPQRARFRHRLQALCEPPGLVSAIESCETDLSAFGG